MTTQKTEDIIMKNVFDLLKGDALQFFGIDKRIIAPARTELNFIELQTNFDDNTYLLDDGTLLHIEFQSTKDKNDIYRFMVSDAVMAFKEHRPVRTMIVYSSDITNVAAHLDLGSITYTADTFYMIAFDGDAIYNEIVGKISRSEKLTKQDLMSLVLLPLMRSKDDKLTRIKNGIELSKKIDDATELMQIQAMLYLMAEKFVNGADLENVKEMINMGAIAEMIIKDNNIVIAKKALRKGYDPLDIADLTGLDESTIKRLKEELESE